jgi:hypothetical protein
MAIRIGSLLIRLAVEHGILQEGLARSERDVAKTTKSIERRAKDIADFGKKLAVAIPLAAIVKNSIDGAIAQRQAIADVSAALASMGNASGKTAGELAKTADQLEMRSLFDADVILKQVTAQLLTFGNVAGREFDRAQQAAVDMATRLGGEPQAAAIMLGKALNDPIKGIAALTRVGVQFTEQQKAQIKAMVEAGNVAGAQGVILKEVERQFSGAADAASNASPFRQFQVIMGQIGDTIGEALLPYILQLRDAVLRNREQILAAAQGALEFGSSLVRLVQALTPLIVNIIAYRAALLVASIAQAAYVAGMTAFSFAAGAAGGAMRGLAAALIANPFVAVATAVGILSAAFIGLANSQSEAKAKTDSLITSLKAAAQARSADFAVQRRALQARIGVLETPQAPSLSQRVARATGVNFIADAVDAEDTKELIRLRRELVLVDKAYEEAGKAADTMKAPVGGATAATSGLSKELRGAGKSAKDAAQEFQALYDRLFPYQAASRKFAEEMAAIQTSRLSDAQKERAISLLEREAFLNRTQSLGDATVSKWLARDTPLVDFGKQMDDLQEQLGAAADAARTKTVRISESFKEMADKSVQALDRMINAIQGGGFLNILSSVIGLGLQLGGMGLFGKDIARNINSPIPGNANGTAYHPGGLMKVGERGPEILQVPRGGRVVPNHELRDAGSQAIRIILDERTDIVEARIGRTVAGAAPAIMDGSAKVTAARFAQRQSRRIGS